MPSNGFPSPTVALEDLLGAIVRGIVSAQGVMDQAAVSAPETSVTLPAGDVSLRPVWFVFERTSVDLEFSTFLSKPTDDASRLLCRTLDPAAVALRGYAASSGAKIHVEIAPLGSGFLRR
jgi:hypothetical protein